MAMNQVNLEEKMTGIPAALWRYKYGLILLVLFLIYPLVTPSIYHLSLLIEVFIFTVFAISYNLMLGYTGIISLGHALFFGMGGYVGGLLMVEADYPFLLIIPIIVLIAIALSVIIGFLTLRVRAIFFAMVTMAIATFFWIVAQRWTDMTGGDDGMGGIIPPDLLLPRENYYYFTLIFMVLAYLFFIRFVNSPTGRILEAIRENEERTRHLGYNVLNFKIIVIVIAGIMATLSGFFYTLSMRFLHPSYLDVDTTLDALLMTVIGGMGTITGPFIGAVVVKPLEHVMSTYTEHWLLIFGIIYVLIVLFLPKGLVPSLKDQADRLRLLGRKLLSKN